MTFRRFVAADWSGARGKRHPGIAVAECGPGTAVPRMVTPPESGPWSRAGILDWLLRRIADGPPTLVGFDFAFSLPYGPGDGYLPGSGQSPASPRELWSLVDSMCGEDGDLYGGAFAEAPTVRHLFWRGGRRATAFDERLRHSDRVCRAAGLGRPQSVFKLIGAAQVGKASLAGMRLLHAVSANSGGRVAFWPFDEPVPASATTCCEVYPGLYTAQAGRAGKVRDGAALNAVLRHFGCCDDMPCWTSVDEHQADALVSAAALRYHARRPNTWRPPSMTAAAGFEGWIVGLT